MKNKNAYNMKINAISYSIAILAIFVAVVGVFYSNGGSRFEVENVYGEQIELYGDGIYAFDTVSRAGVSKGTDAVMIIVSVLFLVVTLLKNKIKNIKYIQLGLLITIMYYSSCLAFGITFNRLFPAYVLLFSASLFGLIFMARDVFSEKINTVMLKSKSNLGTGIFLVISSLSVLMWLQFIIPAVLSGEPMEIIEIYTTEPTFVLDLAIILPLYLTVGIAVLKKNELAYKLTTPLLTFITIIGILVISQNIFQRQLGIIIPLPQLIGLVISFVILGIIATFLNIRFLKKLNQQ